jgi:hypothetical protein
MHQFSIYMQYKLHTQLHEKYAWINDGVRGKKSIGSFQGTSTVARDWALAKVFDSSQNIERWLEKIKEIYKEAKTLEIPEVMGINALESFLAVLRNLDTNYTIT